MKALVRRRWLWETLAAGVLIIAGVLAFWVGQQGGLDTLRVLQITPEQAATAMAHDEFYSDYNEATLVIRGSIASVKVNGVTATVEFAAVELGGSMSDEPAAGRNQSRRHAHPSHRRLTGAAATRRRGATQ